MCLCKPKPTPAEAPLPEYDPFLSRNVAHPITNREALISVVKCAFGTGCLAMPLAFYNSGYITGIIGTAILGSILVFAIHLLMRASHELCKRYRLPSLTYRESMELALLEGPRYLCRFSRFAGLVVDVFQAMFHFGICCVYVLFIGETLKELLQSNAIELPLRLYLILLIFPLVLIFSIQNFKHLVPFSFAANIMLFICLCVIFVHLCYDLPSLSQREPIRNVKQLPLFYGTIVFALESIGVLIAIEANMKCPKDFLGFCGILNQGTFAVLFVYIMMGFYGYWHYGDEVKGNIILNLPHITINQTVQLFYAIGIYFTYALQGYVTVAVVWRQYMCKQVCDNAQGTLERVVRLIFVLSSVLVCVVFPDFDLILPLVGSSCISFLGLIFPAVIDICTRYCNGYGDFGIHLIVDVSLILLGIVGGMTGTFTGIMGLYYRPLEQ